MVVENGFFPLNGVFQTQGDPVSEDVEFDPWIATVVLTPENATADVGTPRTFTARICNSENVLVTAAGLHVKYDVPGTNSATQTVSVGGGTATFTYSGPNPGSDGVWATVIFAGEETTLRDSSIMVWTGVISQPDTGTDFGYLWLGLASIASGIVFNRKKIA